MCVYIFSEVVNKFVILNLGSYLTLSSILLCVLVVGQYQDPWQYVDDIWLMFNNAWLYNRKTSRVYKYCSKLAEVFEQEIDPVMQSLGYCCGRKVRQIAGLITRWVKFEICVGEGQCWKKSGRMFSFKGCLLLILSLRIII